MVVEGLDGERPENVGAVDEERVIRDMTPDTDPEEFNRQPTRHCGRILPSPEAKIVVALILGLGNNNCQSAVLVQMATGLE